jgi:hypothetical protein
MIHLYNGISFDSREEVHFAMWLDELKEAGYIFNWERPNKIELIPSLNLRYKKTTTLKTKVKEENKSFCLLKNLSYTPDFEIKWVVKGTDLFVSPIVEPADDDPVDPSKWFFGDKFRTFVEVKPTFDQHGKTDKFSIIQKIIWHVHKEFVDLIIPEHLFKGTFMPLAAMDDYRYKKAPTGKNKGKKVAGDWKCDFVPKTIKEFLNEN